MRNKEITIKKFLNNVNSGYYNAADADRTDADFFAEVLDTREKESRRDFDKVLKDILHVSAKHRKKLMILVEYDDYYHAKYPWGESSVMGLIVETLADTIKANKKRAESE